MIGWRTSYADLSENAKVSAARKDQLRQSRWVPGEPQEILFWAENRPESKQPYPTIRDVLHRFPSPDIHWTLPLLFKTKISFPHDNISLYGRPVHPWSGGRVGISVSQEVIQTEIEDCHNNNITCWFNFSSYGITPDLLKESLGNFCLEVLDHYSMGVVLSSDILTEHVRLNFPNIQRKASLLRAIDHMSHNDVDWHMKQLDTYDFINVSPLMTVNNLKRFEDKSRLELLLNYECPCNPKQLKECYSRRPNRVTRCKSPFYRRPDGTAWFPGSGRYNMLDTLGVQPLLDLGFTRFKLQDVI